MNNGKSCESNVSLFKSWVKDLVVVDNFLFVKFWTNEKTYAVRKQYRHFFLGCFQLQGGEDS